MGCSRGHAVVVTMAAMGFWVGLGEVQANPTTFQFSGTITSVDDADDVVNVSVGDSWTLAYTFDSAAADQLPGDPDQGLYAVTSAVVTFGTETLTAGGGLIRVLVDAGPPIRYEYLVDVSGASDGGGLETDEVTVSIVDENASPPVDDSLPLTPPNLSDFEIGEFTVVGDGLPGEVGGDFELLGTVDALNQLPVPIPAPGAALLAMIGLPVVGWAKRRSR